MHLRTAARWARVAQGGFPRLGGGIRGFAISRKRIDKTINVVLLEEQIGFGFKGELVNLKRGHARQLIDEQKAVYASDFNKDRFIVEISEEEKKRREDSKTLQVLRKRFSRLRIDLFRPMPKGSRARRKAFPDEPKKHTGVTLKHIVAYLDKRYNMDVSEEFLMFPANEGEELDIEGYTILENTPKKQSDGIENKGEEKRKEGVIEPKSASTDAQEEAEAEELSNPLIQDGILYGFGNFEMKIKVAGYLVPLKLSVKIFTDTETDLDDIVSGTEKDDAATEIKGDIPGVVYK